jgi:hypothetical protein
LASFSIPATVEMIADQCFSGCLALETVRFESGVTA